MFKKELLFLGKKEPIMATLQVDGWENYDWDFYSDFKVTIGSRTISGRITKTQKHTELIPIEELSGESLTFTVSNYQYQVLKLAIYKNTSVITSKQYAVTLSTTLPSLTEGDLIRCYAAFNASG